MGVISMHDELGLIHYSEEQCDGEVETGQVASLVDFMYDRGALCRSSSIGRATLSCPPTFCAEVAQWQSNRFVSERLEVRLLSSALDCK